MSEAAIVFSEFNGDNDAAAAISRVRERILDTSDQLATGMGGVRKKKYKRNSIPETEKEKRRLQLVRQAEYQQVVAEARAEGNPTPNIWSFECLFPDPVWDETCIKRDLFSIKDQDQATLANAKAKGPKAVRTNMGPLIQKQNRQAETGSVFGMFGQTELKAPSASSTTARGAAAVAMDANAEAATVDALGIIAAPMQNASTTVLTNGKVDRGLTRLVEDKIYGYRRTVAGQFQYETSLMGDGAIQFRDGVRLGNPLPLNTDRMTYFAKKELQHGRVEEAKELYETAVKTDPRDGRAYLGLSRCAERRRDFKLARDWLRAGIQNSAAKPASSNTPPDQGGNPFLLQALGRMEEKRGHLAEAESLYVQAARSRPSHAAAWVSLAQLRTRKLGQTIASGRVCYETAERELERAGLPQNSHVYTAWAALEYHGAGDVRRARQLFQSALKVDPKCSAAWLQLGVMEADNENWDAAEEGFEKVLKFDKRNTRVMQAYALMETRRPEGSSRKAIDLFERALKVNPRDAGVLQPYALYVAELGDLEAARELFRRGTEVKKRHAPVWQAWGVLEMRHGHPEEARKIFQQGIWACAQLAGNQSGGYHCARLWQAWGVLEAREGDYPAARRCFSRALDADSRNVATVTAWTNMEEELGNIDDARALLERSLKNYAPGCDAKTTLWRAYELMEQRSGNVEAAQNVYQRSMRESFNVQDDNSFVIDEKKRGEAPRATKGPETARRKNEEEVEVSRWDELSSMGGGEVWMNNGVDTTKKARNFQ
ncbi:tetratricopeptide repeat [Seminavis robusta]|uniref:Tetratricopeptide repeat n=1 Tax=Seminavis robusta TaxID=568900 RepID=A0A9N8E862_9STRA|nr:tetratricopeptide repeat [Seminavis robusta]|eukprot:Sro760_g198370.1 tetratricopeptide repeat (771) ;mRNA; r:21130-23534